MSRYSDNCEYNQTMPVLYSKAHKAPSFKNGLLVVRLMIVKMRYHHLNLKLKCCLIMDDITFHHFVYLRTTV